MAVQWAARPSQPGGPRISQGETTMSADASNSPDALKSSGERARLVDAEFDIHAVLRSPSMSSHFQPIISIRGKKVIGLEALIRATNPESGNAISPAYLFNAASRHKQTVQLERICPESALSGFATVAGLDPDLILFVNVD